MQVPHNLQVPHDEVRERVSSILEDYGFCPTGGISIGNLYLLTLLLHYFNNSKFVFKPPSTRYVYMFIYFLYLFLKVPLCGCIVQRRVTLQTWYVSICSD